MLQRPQMPKREQAETVDSELALARKLVTVMPKTDSRVGKEGEDFIVENKEGFRWAPVSLLTWVKKTSDQLGSIFGFLWLVLSWKLCTDRETLRELAFINQILTFLVWLVQRSWVSVLFLYGLTMIPLNIVTHQSSPRFLWPSSQVKAVIGSFNRNSPSKMLGFSIFFREKKLQMVRLVHVACAQGCFF